MGPPWDKHVPGTGAVLIITRVINHHKVGNLGQYLAFSKCSSAKFSLWCKSCFSLRIMVKNMETHWFSGDYCKMFLKLFSSQPLLSSWSIVPEKGNNITVLLVIVFIRHCTLWGKQRWSIIPVFAFNPFGAPHTLRMKAWHLSLIQKPASGWSGLFLPLCVLPVPHFLPLTRSSDALPTPAAWKHLLTFEHSLQVSLPLCLCPAPSGKLTAACFGLSPFHPPFSGHTFFPLGRSPATLHAVLTTGRAHDPSLKPCILAIGIGLRVVYNSSTASHSPWASVLRWY